MVRPVYSIVTPHAARYTGETMVFRLSSVPPSSVIVLGAGMIGSCTALHLQERGCQVVLIDRHEPGRETSHGNAGLIQRESVEPYPFPRQWRKLWQVLWQSGADVHYHLKALPGLISPLWGYYRHSGPARYPQVVQAYSRLIAHCVTEHQVLMQGIDVHDLVTPTGYLDGFRTPAAWAAAVQDARRLTDAFGIRHEVLDSAGMAHAEPALRARLAGGLLWQDPWAVSDPGALVGRYAEAFVQRGGTRVRADIRQLHLQGAGWQVQTTQDTFEAPTVVLALGPWAARWTQSLGYRMPLFVKRGYHQHYGAGGRLKRPLLDAESGYVLAPMRRGMRLTTGAEFAHVDAPPTPVQVAKAEVLAREWLDLRDPLDDPPWLGARPCTADMLPVMGPAPRHPGLWFNFGHAHQGFTLGPVAGRMLAELITGETPFIDPTPYRADRF